MNNKKQIYIIEHLEPELFPWCIYEYEHISELVGKENLWITNITNKKDSAKLNKIGKIFSERVWDLDIDFSKVCILDPEANSTLSSEDSSLFEYFIFGGILGDYPPRKRTKEELSKFIPDCEKRDIGKEQMSTDNAVFTVFQIVHGKNFSDLKFKDGISVEINDFESIDLPYRYNIIKEKFGSEVPFISEKVIEYLKNKRGF